MLPIVGYTDKLTVAPGENLDVMASSFGAKTYTADLRRIIQGDTNPEGPGYKDEFIPVDLGSARTAVAKPFRPGSCVIIPGQEVIDTLGSFTIAAVIQPTLNEDHDRTVISLPGLAKIGLDRDGHLTGGLLAEGAAQLRSSKPVSCGQWHLVSLSFDSTMGKATLSLATDRDGASVPAEPDAASVQTDGTQDASAKECLIAADRNGDGELTAFFDGKIDRPAIFNDVVTPELLKNLLSDFSVLERQRNLVSAWDFSLKMTTQIICDIGPYKLDGAIHNAPARAMTGWLWKAQELNWNKRPDLYSAIHFHSSDVYDVGWAVDFSITIPDDLKSGVYAVRLVPDGDEDSAYYCVFVVRPPRDRVTGNTVAFLFPTCSYLAYGNHRLGMDVQEPKLAWAVRLKSTATTCSCRKIPELATPSMRCMTTIAACSTARV